MKINRREKRFLMFGGIAAILIIIFSLFSWYSDFMQRASSVSEAKVLLLKKQLIKLHERDALEMQVNALKEDSARQKSSLIEGEKTPVAAAELQRILKEMASSLNIDVNLERTLAPVDYHFYVGIPVEIGFTADTDKLSGMLYMLKVSPLLLTLTEMKVRVPNVNNPVNVNATLIIMGFIEKPSEQQTAGSEEGKDAS